MLELIFGTAFAIALRMLMGHSAIKFTVLKSWLTWFDWLAIIVAVITAVVIVLYLIREIVKLCRENKQGRER